MAGQRHRSRPHAAARRAVHGVAFYGSRRLTATLRTERWPINRKRVQRLIRLMGIAALGPKPNTSKPTPGHEVCPYLLRDLSIERPNQVCAADIMYVPFGSRWTAEAAE